MSFIDSINFEDVDSLEQGMIKIVENNSDDELQKLRKQIESKTSSQEWIVTVLLPLTTRKFFTDYDLSKVVYNIPYRVVEILAINYNSSQLLTLNQYSRKLISTITNIIETSNTNINVTMSMIDKLNTLCTSSNEDELVCRLQFHIIQEVILNTIKRLKVIDFDFNELFKLIITSYLKFFIRISKIVKDPLFLMRRAFLFTRDFLPPESLAEDEDVLENIRTLLPIFLFKAFEIIVTCKESSYLLKPEKLDQFKKIGEMYYQLALSFDVDFEKELKNLETDCQKFIDAYKENCKDKADDEIQEYLYHLSVIQDTKPDRIRVDYKTLLYLILTNANKEENLIEINLNVLLISLFKINAFYTANDYNNPIILNGVITAKLLSMNDNKSISDIPEKIITQILQQLSFGGNNGVALTKHILKLMPYEYQVWYCIDTIQECPLPEIRASFWKEVLDDVIKHNDKENWINICNVADIQVLKYTETKFDNDDEKLSERYVIESMLKFLKKFKALENFEKTLRELLELYEQIENDEDKEKKNNNDIKEK
ncbi:uncharacterized protein HGUI_00676 [Hanseniaspora guilliermondii]|uniref:Uncharacterized protein n=1 Tax=Hanseniaspora guilliermondii TaxID=56406 RepID=A0A1L0AY52_9ASCO|nr:uncharacterized protein HGUI_00676 [Hanseniaspora guilliermondii]